ncbi:hypothetical protein SAMN02799622_00924 [Methylobacterium sp. UNC378MF]|uniref:hypothetical protein n=1 Tax=Methylobacterium sp. UNC378MF TaxID=1502748 RepID=UPI00088DB9B8|nr:hypothetical protein [Methylobacterium sp. UNC378MF]SDA13153.1 hypothetical protein SAMN02799622_00924 [Methylobacterium sp. UNC378MF]
MPDDPAPLVHVYLTPDPLFAGEILEVWGKVVGDTVHYGAFGYCLTGEGRQWHRQRWAAENYARQLQAARLAQLRDEIARVEGFRFGRPGS